MGDKAIVLIAGAGERFGSEVPKQFHRLAGKKIYLHTLEKCVESALFEEIVLVSAPEWIEQVREEVSSFSHPRITVMPGGKSRQESSYLGLLACGTDTELVLIHDGVRPFVSTRILRDNLTAARKFGAVDTCIASADTIVYSPNGGQIAAIPKRAEYLRGQTPQTFQYPIILEAHLFAKGRDYR